MLVFFLLVYSTEQVDGAADAKDVQLPESIAETQIHDAVVVIVTEQEIIIHGKSVGKVDEILASDSVIIPSLQAELEAEANGMVGLAGLSEEERIAALEVTIMADKELPYRL